LYDQPQPLSIRSAPDSSGWWLEISATEPNSRAAKFVWPSGVKLVVETPNGLERTISVEDWYIYRQDGESDSNNKAFGRAVYWWIALILLLLALAAAVWPAEKAASRGSHQRLASN